jgi:DNA polymerase III epsilon subunit-like protein
MLSFLLAGLMYDLHDVRYLRQHIGIPLDGLSHQMPESTPREGMFIVDTSDLFAALEGDGERNRRSLDRICKHLQIPTRYLHNAGNDAHVGPYVRSCISKCGLIPVQYTFLAMRSMASGEPVDLQRETRWPNRTNSTANQGPKVQFQAWEENSDYSDLEGVVPSAGGYDPITGKLMSRT